MPAEDVQIDANYDGGYTVKVNGGKSNVSMAASGARVELTVPNDDPEGKVFRGWEVISGGVTIEDPTSKVTYFTMKNANVEITANLLETHEITIENGKATPESAAKGDTVTITANPPEGKVFKNWVGSDGVVFENVNNKETTFIMPDKPVEIKAEFTDLYKITVNNGRAEPEYALPGWNVKIFAKEPSEGQGFKEWKINSEGITLDDRQTAITFFEMSAKDVEVTANFEKGYKIVVNNGYAVPESYAAEGAKVLIYATPAEGEIFMNWEILGTDVDLEGPEESFKSFIMPAGEVEITAIIKKMDLAAVTYNANGGTGKTYFEYTEIGKSYTLLDCKFTPPKNKVFKAWLVGSKEYKPGSKIVISEKNTEAKAIWIDKKEEAKPPVIEKTYQIHVYGGSANKRSAKAGEIITITAKEKDFIRWEGNVTLDDRYDYETTFTMPAKDVEIDAIYRETPHYPHYPEYPIWGWGYEYNKPSTPIVTPTPETKINLQAKLTIGSKILEKTLNGSKTEIKMDIAPFTKDGRTMVPIRYAAEALGFNVEWDLATWTVTLKDKYNTVKISVNTNQIIVNGNVYESDVKPILEKGRTMLPIGNVARALGLKDGVDVIWNEKTQEVIIKREIVVK